MNMIIKTLKTSPKWIGENWKTISSIALTIWSVLMFTTGWFSAVNAAAKGFPDAVSRITVVEQNQKNFQTRFDTFMEMYKLEVLGRKSEAQDLARSLPSPNKP